MTQQQQSIPASVYNNVTAGNAVTIKVTNSDGSTSTTVNVTALALPTGGSIYTSGGYRYHKFTSSGTFTQTLNRTVEYLIVAGGGAGGGSNSGGNRDGGGGGAGGLRGGSVSTTPQGYTITIGAGGSGTGSQVSERGNSGSNSSAFGVTSTGGGGGGGGDNGGSGSDGGNGTFGGGGGTLEVVDLVLLDKEMMVEITMVIATHKLKVVEVVLVVQVLMEIIVHKVEELVMVVLVQMLIQLGQVQHLLVIVDTMLEEVVVDGMVLIHQ